MIKNLGQVAAIYVGKTAPRNVNMIWLDNTVIPYVFKSYNGEEWTEIPTGAWVETYVNGWLVSLQQGTVTTDDDYLLINSRGVNYRMTVKDFVKSSVGNPLDFKGVIRTDSDFPNPSTLEGGDMYIIITEPAGGTVTDPYSGKTFSDSEKIVWDSVINSWASLGKIDVKVDLSTTYSATEVTIHSSAGKETTVVGVTDDNAGVMVPVQKKWLDSLSNGSTLTPQGPLTAPYHKHRYSDIVDRIISQQVTGDSAINPMSQKATTEALDLKLDKTSVLQVSGVSTTDVMSQKAVTDAIQTLKSSVDDKLSRYLPLSGGTMTGTIKLATNNVHIEGLGQDGTTTYHILSLDAANRPTFGSSNVGVVIQTKTENILHKKDSGTFIVHDTSNLPDPAKLSADQTFTGTNNFTAGKFQVGVGSRFRVDSMANLDIDGIVSGGWTKELSFHSRESSSSDTIKRGAFGIKADGATESLSTDYFYLTLGDSTWFNAEYKFFNNTLKVPNTWYLQNSGGYQFVAINSNNVRLGSSNLLTILRSSNSDLTHRKYTASSTYTDYKIWDESNLPSPASSGDLANYLPLVGGVLSGPVYLKNGVKLNSYKTDGTAINLISEDNSNNTVIGNGSPTRIYTSDSDLMHYIGSTGYKIYDSHNLPNPVQTSDLADYVVKSDLDAYATKAELGDYATKQWVTDNFSGGGSGADLLPSDNTWSGTNTYTKNIVLNNNVSLASNKTDGSLMNIASINTSDVLALGNIGLDVKISSSYSDLIHKKSSGEYKIWDASNLANPVQTSDLDSYATKTWIGEQGYLTNSSLTGYATQQWVKDQEYITGADIPPIVIANSGDGNAVTSITATGHTLTVTKEATYLTQSSLAGYATETWVTNKGYLTSSSLDGYAKTTDLASYLPLAGGSMTGAINFGSSQVLTLENKPLIAYDKASNYVNVGSYSLNSRLFFLTSQTDLQHYRKNDGELAGTSYKIWDAYNVSSPLDYMKGTAGQVASVSGKEISINGVNQTHIVLGLGGNGITLFAPTTAGISGQVLQSQGAGKAPIWVDGGAGGGVQLSDNNTWTGLNTFQGGLKTSDGTNSYDVWDKNNLKYVARITPADIGYALSFYTTTAGWRDFDDLAINNLTPKGLKTIAQGGIGYVGTYDSAFASAEIKDIVTQNVYGFDGKNLSNASTGASFLGNESNAFKSAHIGEVNTNTVKSADGKSLLNFKTDGVYMIANSGTEYKLATLNDIGGGGSSVSLDGNNTWTGVNIFSGTGLVTNQYDSGNTEIPATASYSIRLACGGSYDNYGFGAVRSEDGVKQSHAFVQTPSAFFTFDNSGSLYTTIGNTKYEFWNKQNLAKPIVYNTNSDGDGVLYKGDSTANRIDSLELVGILPPTNDAVTLSNGGTGGFGNVDNAYAEAYIGNVHANNVTTATIVVPGSENYFEFKEDGLHFYDIVNQEEYKINMTKV